MLCKLSGAERPNQDENRPDQSKAQRIQDRSPNARRIQVEIAQAEGTPILQRLFGRLRTIPVGPNICRMQELPAGAREGSPRQIEKMAGASVITRLEAAPTRRALASRTATRPPLC